MKYHCWQKFYSLLSNSKINEDDCKQAQRVWSFPTDLKCKKGQYYDL